MESWRDVVGFEGKYQVSNQGQIKSLNYKRTGTSRLLTLKVNQGYLYVGLALGRRGLHKEIRVHRIVAQSFLSNWDSILEVNHIDGDKLNNRLENLVMVTPKENMKHARETGLHDDRGVKNSRARYTQEEVDMMRWYYYCKGKSQCEIAVIFGTKQPQVNFIVKYKRYPHVSRTVYHQ